MVVFHGFKIVYMVPNRAKHHIFLVSLRLGMLMFEVSVNLKTPLHEFLSCLFLSVFSMMIINVTVLTSNCSIDVPAKIFVDVERYLKVEAIDIASIAGTWKLVKPNFLVIEV